MFEHLLQTAPARRTPFERALAENDTYMANLAYSLERQSELATASAAAIEGGDEDDDNW